MISFKTRIVKLNPNIPKDHVFLFLYVMYFSIPDIKVNRRNKLSKDETKIQQGKYLLTLRSTNDSIRQNLFFIHNNI